MKYHISESGGDKNTGTHSAPFGSEIKLGLMKKIALLLCIIALFICNGALALEFPTEPPLQV